ncbi:MAG TPA: response regulator [Desulfomonilaceae bacterium]|nr:response regulator [Desulfomonilaceae bacterium]
MKGRPLAILLVEDNGDHAEIIRRSFNSHQVANTIHHVTDGQAALDYLLRKGKYKDAKSSPRPDVILLDLRLPKVDGLEVLEKIKQTKELLRIPVVILTSSDADLDIARAYDFHANSYLVKPIDFRKFTDLMKDLGFYWLCWNVNPFVQGTPG